MELENLAVQRFNGHLRVGETESCTTSANLIDEELLQKLFKLGTYSQHGSVRLKVITGMVEDPARCLSAMVPKGYAEGPAFTA
jgi:hypothetical protein